MRRRGSDPAAGAPAPGVGAPGGAPGGAPARTVPAHHWLRGVWGGVRHTGNTDSWDVEVIPGGTDMCRVGWGAGAMRFVTREQEEVVEVDVSPFTERVIFLWRNTRRVALSSTHHLESKVSVHKK